MNKHRKAGATIGQRSVEKMRVGVKWGGYTWERSSNTFFTFCFKMSRKLSWNGYFFGCVTTPFSLALHPWLKSMENYKQRNCYQICLLLFNNNVDLKNIFKNSIKICFNSILIYHVITYDAVMKKTPPPRCSPFERAGGNAPALRRPCLPLSALTVSPHYLPRWLCSTVTSGKNTLTIVTWSEH